MRFPHNAFWLGQSLHPFDLFGLIRPVLERNALNAKANLATENRSVGGSIPPPGTIFNKD